MESNLNERTDHPDMAKIALYSGSEYSVIRYWIDHPDTKPSGMNKAVFEAEAKIRDLQAEVRIADAEARKIQSSAAEYGRRLRSNQEAAAMCARDEKTAQAKADEKAAEAKDIRAKIQAAEAELRAAQNPTNGVVA